MVDEGTSAVTVELFGHARRLTGVQEIEVCLPSKASASDLAQTLAARLPRLIGVVVDQENAGLLASYTANLNGMCFMSDCPVRISEGDRILVFSSQAGG